MGHYTASMKRVREIGKRLEGRMNWTRERPTQAGWYWVQALGKIFVIEIREYDLLFGGRPELKAVKAWAGPLEPPD